ncbi:DUF2182 domain-containing protein [Frateuria defendens]|uniref:DUF2182 domain-containing protein n=1 Tax=Frateuria defendens TaxID=2219559 RepID=UPI00066FDDA5|nr:DUF2182 domain-containing protein [Frateuria defendens]
MASGLATARGLLGIPALLFAASAALTIHQCIAMSAMGGMPMPGGWTMSMAWMRMGGQGWPGSAASFLGMWVVMMVAMMLPSLVPVLGRYRRAVGDAGGLRGGSLAALAGVGYFVVWTALGLAVFPLGAALAAAAMRWPALSRTVPFAAGAVVMGAGAMQFTAWKRRQLARCRIAPACGHAQPAGIVSACRDGLRLGFHCCVCCTGMTAILLVTGVMDLWVMAAATVAITAERLAPAAGKVAGGVGILAVATGAIMLVRAASG